jgi:Skp family chaperone for outer membrane proteins
VKDAREDLERSRRTANEEIAIFREELGAMVEKLKEIEENLKNPNLDSSSLRAKHEEQVKKAQEKQDELIQYDQRTKATIEQRQRNLLVEHIADIRSAVSSVAVIKKLDIVINSSETQLGVFYVKPTLDFTTEVIATLNAVDLATAIAEAELTTGTTPHTNGWYYQPDWGWIWTDAKTFPYVYRSSSGGNQEGWLYFREGSASPIYFYSYEESKWVTLGG